MSLKLKVVILPILGRDVLRSLHEKSVVNEALLPFSSLQIKYEPLIFLNYSCTLHREADKVSCESNCEIPKCGTMEVPTKYLRSCVVENTIKRQEGIGAKAHFLLFVTLGTMVKNCDKKEVYSISAHCQQGYMDQPIAGYIDICKEKVVERKLRSQELTQDILHSLAFSQSLYPFFHDANGIPRTSRDNETNLPPMESSLFVASDSTIRNNSRNWLAANGFVIRNVTMLVTDNVVIQSRLHFGCSDVEGAELEDGAGIPGFAMSHFEKRVFKNDIMTGTHNDEVIARTYTEQNAQHLLYAHEAGCEFVRSTCLEWAQTRCSDCFNPYCDELKDQSAFDGVLTRSCAPNGKSLVDCKLIRYTNDLEPMFQYINSTMNGSASAKGGPDALMDYCPIYHDYFGIENITSGLRTSDVGQWICADVRNNEKEKSNWYGAYGEESRCFAFDKPWPKQDCNDTDCSDKILQRFYPPNVASSILLFNSLLITMFILL